MVFLNAIFRKVMRAYAEAALHRYSWEKVFWKYAADLQETAMRKCYFNKVAK